MQRTWRRAGLNEGGCRYLEVADLWVNLGSAMALSSVILSTLSSQPQWAVLQNGYKHSSPKTRDWEPKSGA